MTGATLFDLAPFLAGVSFVALAHGTGDWITSEMRSVMSAPSPRSAAGEPTTVCVPSRRRHRRSVRQLRWVAALVAVAVIVDWPIAVLVVVGRISWPRVTSRLEARRRIREIDRAAPDAIELLVLVIHAGLTPHQAVAAMTTLAPDATRSGFVEVVRRVERGQSLADALAGLPAELGSSMTTVADTLAIAERHGTPIGRALEQLSAEVRQRRRRQAEAAARTLPVRLSFPLVACTLPSFVLVAIAPAVLAALSSLGDSPW